MSFINFYIMIDYDKEILTSKIKNLCLKSGFYKVGISKVEEFKNEKSKLQNWLDENRNADMDWILRSFEKRIDIKKVKEDIKSVISLTYLYDTPFEHSININVPKISRYAWGEKDYHKILKKKLKYLCKEIESISPNISTKYYVDDGPVTDKTWAVKSGIGWMGKNTNVIDPNVGSFFFLSEILINAELDYGEPIEDLCGTCNICVSACPTGAIYEPYKLDANHCISYQTIENKNDIPDFIDLNGWIFGCDICQDVCPYNKKNIFTENKDFIPKKNIFNKTYDELLSLTEEEFNKEFEGTPVRRTKYKGWIRNLLKAKKGM
jgi:epoxyqueuosine reductase